MIAVAATDKNKALAKYSNYGTVTLAAPGGAGSLVGGGIDIHAQGKGLDCDADPLSYFDDSIGGVVVDWTTSNGDHCARYLAGTSLAAPHVAGVVGLMLSRNPSLTPAQVRQILQNTAQPACNGKCGAGLLDANAAVQQVAPLPVNDPKPTASFTVQCFGLQCTFNGGGSTDNQGIVAYEWILPGQQFRLGSVVNAFMPGYGSKSAKLRVTDGRGQSTLISKNFTISQPVVNPVAGQYHNPSRPDNRIDLYETSDSGLTLTWFTFDRSGNPVWYTSGAGQRLGARWTQPLYRSSWKYGVSEAVCVGSVSLDFSSSTEAWFSWVLDTEIDDDVVSVPGGERFSHLFGGQGRSGAWFMPPQPGWGISGSAVRDGGGRELVMTEVLALAETTGLLAACEALCVPRSTVYRRRQEASPPARTGPRPRPPRALSEAEQAKVMDTLHAEPYVDKAPREIWAALLEVGVYLCSVRTMYRLLELHGEIRERRDQRRHPEYNRPELLATGPLQIWSWDITLLRGPTKGIYYRLYVLLDIFSRYVVGWMLAEREDAELAKQFLANTFAKQGSPIDLTIHADNGSAPASETVSRLFRHLGITESHSRPHVSDDNPYSEALFKTKKYRPDFPDRFASIDAARAHCRAFFDWYNNHHFHTGIALLTPFVVHHGLVAEHQAARQEVLDHAYLEHPERFVHRRPTPPSLPEAVYINPPRKQTPTPIPQL